MPSSITRNPYASIYMACIYAGVVSFLIGFFSTGVTSYGAYTAGYSVLILGILLVSIVLFTHVLNNKSGLSGFAVFYSIFMTTGPFLLILALMGFILYLLIVYKDKIVNENVSSGYKTFNNITVMLLLIQFYIIYSNINTPKFEANGEISKVTLSLIYFFCVIITICTIILYTILKYYSTDGFTPMLMSAV